MADVNRVKSPASRVAYHIGEIEDLLAVDTQRDALDAWGWSRALASGAYALTLVSTKICSFACGLW